LSAAVAVIFLASLLPVGNWFFNRRTARRFFVVAIWLVTLFVCFRVEESWRGARAWNACREQLKAQGTEFGPGGFQIRSPFPTSRIRGHTVRATLVLERTNAHKWTDDAYSKTAPRVADNTNDVSHRLFLDLVAWKLAFHGGESRANEFGPAIHIGHKLDPASRAEAAPAILEMLEEDQAFFRRTPRREPAPLCALPDFLLTSIIRGAFCSATWRASNMSASAALKACANSL